MTEPKLIFTMDLPESPQRHLILGNLALDYDDDRVAVS